MGMDLTRPAEGRYGHFSINCQCWRKLLGLAEEHGWTPEGTRPPQDRDCDWSGSYYSNDGQEVAASDASAIAAALEQAHQTLDDQPPEVSDDEEEFLKDLSQYASFDEILEEFVRFCRVGAFYIW